MRRIAVLAGAASLAALYSCDGIEESKVAAKRDAMGLRAVEAIERGDLEGLKALLGKDPKAANTFRWTSGRHRTSLRARTDTPLTVALKARNAAAVDLLLSAGADPNLALDSGDAPLDVLASVEPRDETALALAKTLVEHGAQLGPRTVERTGETTSPLLSLLRARAASDDDEGLLRLFASDASALGAADLRGRTPLHVAARTCGDRAVEVLLEAGADPNVRSVSAKEAFPTQRVGDTPLHDAANCRELGVVFALCAGGANPRLRNEAGETPLEALLRTVGADKDTPATGAVTRPPDGAVAALSPGGPCESWHGRFLREGRPATWEAVRAARSEHGCTFDERFDCGESGWAYHKGEGVAVDLEKAMAAYRKACTLKSSWACGMVGVLFADGAGAPRDPAEAARWFASGCDGGDGQSCYRLGTLARDGRGVSPDRSRALALFEKACAKRYEKGCEAARTLR